MKACLRSRDGSCVHQLRQAITTIGCEGSDVIIQVTRLLFFPGKIIQAFKVI